MKKTFRFTFDNLIGQLLKAKNNGYGFVRCIDFYHSEKNKTTLEKTVVFRIDVDFSISKTAILLDVLKELELKASFYIRLHAPEYNPFSFDNYLVIKRIIDEGHELGYHSEIIDQSAIWGEEASNCLKRDLNVLGSMFGKPIQSVASHGGMTGLNNLSFWKTNSPKDFNLLFEAYDNSEDFNLFNNSLYISDSEWTQWKCYNNGSLIMDDRRNFGEHLDDKPNLIYLLIHPDTYYIKHFYEN